MKPSLALTLSLLGLTAAAPSMASVATSALIGQNDYSTPEVTTACAGCVNAMSHTQPYIGYDSAPGETTVSTYAMADYGVLEAASSTRGVGTLAESIAYARASFADSFRIDAAGLTGQKGYFTAQVAMPFTLTTENASFTNEYLFGDVQVTSYNSQHTEKYQLSAGTQSLFGHDALLYDGSEVAFNAPMILEVPFIYGESISIQAHLNTSVSGYTYFVPISFSASMDASHSVVWEGMSSVTDGDGHAVTDYTVTSDSGTDWSRNLSSVPTPVPEPGIALSMLAGLGLVGLRRRARLDRIPAL